MKKLLPASIPPSASEALAMIAEGRITRAGYLDACLAAIDASERQVGALASLDAAAARSLAASLDGESAGGLLDGVPLGVKDVFETVDLPTEFNSPHYAGHRGGKDAGVVGVLRREGAIVLAKTTTVEFASVGRVAPTVNPHDRERTPGGSSSGSAAAVACGMVPIALATQTGGSTIRPAAFCGVAAMKPTYGRVSCDGMRLYAPSLDTVGWMARSVADLALVARALRVADGQPARPTRPRIGVYRTPYWDQAEPETRQVIDTVADGLARAGAVVDAVAGPPDADRLNEAQDNLMHGEGRAAYLDEYLRFGDELHPQLRDEVENRKGIDADAMRWSYDYVAAMRPQFDRAMLSYDAWLTPAVPGVAPVGLESTGDATFNRLWTALHLPAVTLPGMTDPAGLPVGVQLVAPRYADEALLGISLFVESVIADLDGR